MKTVLEVKDVHKSYEQAILKGASLKATQGETIAIMGPSGSGKTTILRIIIGLEKPDKGKVTFLGERISNKNHLSLKRKMSIVFQKPVALNRSVYENVAYGLKIRRANKEEVDKKVQEALDFVGIPKELHSKNALRLSGGEVQRVAIARSLITEPELLLLDEPTANLDEENINRIEELIQKIMKRGKTTTIIATHNKEQAKRLGRIYELREGKIAKVEP